MDHLKQERTTELSTCGFTTVTKLKAMLKKLGIKLSKKSNLKAELIHILVEHEFANAEATENNDLGEGKSSETDPGPPSCTRTRAPMTLANLLLKETGLFTALFPSPRCHRRHVS